MTLRSQAFSLIELVIVVVIIGVIAAIAVPRMGRAQYQAGISAMDQNLAIMNKAVELYAAEHLGAFPAGAKITDQLTRYTDSLGQTADARDRTHIYGPYLRAVPPLSFGPKKGNRLIGTADGAGVGWIYLPVSGRVIPNLFSGGVVPATLMNYLDLPTSEKVGLVTGGILPP